MPSGKKQTEYTDTVCSLYVFTQVPAERDHKFHNRTVPSAEAETSSPPPGEKHIEFTGLECPVRVFTQEAVDKDQIRIVWSADPEARQIPSEQ